MKISWQFSLFIPLSLLFLIQYACTFSEKEGSVQSKKFKNVLWIVSDDLATHALGCYGNFIIETPNIDRLAKRSVQFNNAYANSPMCTPSRASYITGLYPHKTGTTLLRSVLSDDNVTIAEHLKPLGYRTGIFGKTHFNSDLSHGFDAKVLRSDYQLFLKESNVVPDTNFMRPVWKPFNDHARIWLNAEGRSSGYSEKYGRGRYFANQALDFIGKDNTKPFFAMLSFNEPHSPFNFPNEYIDKYKDTKIELPQGTEEDAKWVPKVFNDLTDEEKIGITKSYYSSVTSMDANVGVVLDELEAKGLLENTLIVLHGDHGYLLNHHGRFEKHMMWKEAVMTPLLISDSFEAKVIDSPVELVDIIPTVTELLQIESIPDLDGKSLLPIIEGDVDKHKEYVLVEYYTDRKLMITDGKWKYIYSQGHADLGSDYETGNGAPGITHRLYNMDVDPNETSNVIGDKANFSLIYKLKTELVSYFIEDGFVDAPSEVVLDSMLYTYSIPPEHI